MASPYSRNESSGLSESTFEFVAHDNTEEGSQDERADSMSESLSEYERYPHPDEVQAFNGLDDMSQSASAASTCESASEDEDDESGRHQEFLPFTHEGRPRNLYEDEDEMLRNSFTQGSIPKIFSPNSRPILPVGSIAFSEPEDVDVHIDKISVKHTIKEFSETDAIQLFQSLGLGDVPKRLCATIRQTMSQRCLSTHEAFRVMYIGDESPKSEIILKISRAITCSSSVDYDYNENKALRRNTEGVYNIVPVTFGAVNDRDVELMEASGFQIKVDTCIDAEKIPIEGEFFRGDIVYSLTVDGGNGGKNYKSVPAGGPGGAKIHPAWSFPHVAVVYCSEDDDEDMHRVQRIVWEFCRRHAIPCLYISDRPAFVSPAAAGWRNYANEHAVHLSLESRDPKSRESDWSEQRFPIDLASFLNIDNRQMNKNLAYLTGLQDPPYVANEKLGDIMSLSASEQDILNKESKEWKLYLDKFLEPYLQLFEDYRYFSVLCSLALILLVGVSAWLINVITVTSVPVPLRNAVADVHSVAPAMITSTATVTVSQTSTRTVKLATVETPAFGGLLSDIAHTVSSDPTQKSSVCTVEMYSGNEILIKLPSGTKTSWLAKGAIDIDVFRGSNPVKSKLSSTDDGILIEINQKDAYGVLNVSVVTTRKPKINETFAVDFGTSFLSGAFEATKDAFDDLYETLANTAHDAAKSIEDNYTPDFAATAQKLGNEAISWWESMKGASRAAHDYSSQKAGETFDRVKESFPSDDIASYLKNAQKIVANHHADILERHGHMVGNFRDDADLAILKAQITSKLWWLKLQGKTEEHDEYERQARAYIKKRYETLETKKLQKTCAEAKRPRTGEKPCRCKNKGLGRWMA
ncbi:hypothetical protein VP1G_06459 [Cytospora mali]|uniref:Uncharacterized protein n=1 Tax=Cytospora mali TaxID=578113 RepID=A0A194V5J5_CYTMA|nr:hypothetical protein VP1G_06459 [Valsa mali var. pyri (nom. inval.)]